MSADQPFTLDGRTVLITGAARRIGATIAQQLHAAGANIAIHFRSSESDAGELSDSLNKKRPGSASVFQADLAETAACETLVDTASAWNGRLDVLINNASAFYPTPLGNITETHWDDLVDSNLKAPIFLAQASWSHLEKSSGTIVNIVDIHARRPLRNYSVYVAAKAGLEMLTRSLAKEMAPAVRVNGVAPGAILWPEDDMTDATRGNILRQVPMGRSGAPEDIAACVLFLVQDATYTTGHVVAVDGGRSAGW